MSRLVRQYGSTTAPPTTTTVTTTETVTETIRVCEPQPVVETAVHIVGGNGEIGVGESIILPGPLSDLELEAFLESQPDGTVVIVMTDTGQTTEVCHEETITREVTRETETTTPGATLPTFQQGWDGGADSVASLVGNGGFQFQLRSSSLGVFCGLNDASNNTDPYEIDYAVYGSHGTYTTYPGGETGSFTDNTVFLIQRLGNTITWLVDNKRVHTQDFTSIPNTLWADASLYASDDEVFNPEFVGVSFLIGEGDGTLPRFTSDGLDVIRGASEAMLPLLITTGDSWLWGSAEAMLPRLNGFGAEVAADGYGIVILPALTSTAIAGLWGRADSSLPAFASLGQSGLWGTGDGSLPPLNASGRAALWATGDGILPMLTSFGKQGTNGYGVAWLPVIQSHANDLSVPTINYGLVSLPPLHSRSHGVLRFNQTGESEGALPMLLAIGMGGVNSSFQGWGFVSLPSLISRGSESGIGINIGFGLLPSLTSQGFSNQGTNFSVLPKLQSLGAGDVIADNLFLNGLGITRLPALDAWGRQITNSGFVSLGTPIVASHGGINHWNGYCFNDPIRQQLESGLKGTWLSEAEKRIETYFGLLGSNTRELQIKYNYDEVSGVAAFVATYYQNNVPQRFELTIDLLDFVPPDLMSAGIRIDRILAHELVHAVMNDRIGTLNWPNWFNEGLCEFLHGASERVKDDLAQLGTANLLNSLNDNVSGHAAMSSYHYSAGYLAVWKLHSVISGGIATLLAALENGSDLNAALAAHTPFSSAANFLTWMTGANGVAFVNDLVNRQLFDNADTGAIGGFDVDGGPILDDSSVISVALP